MAYMKWKERSEGYDPRPYDMRPLISGEVAFRQEAPVTPSPVRSYPKPSTDFYAYRVFCPAGGTVQANQASLAVQYVLIYNPVATGASIFVAETQPSLVAPVAGQASPGTEIEAGMGMRIDIDDLSKLWFTSTANAIISITGAKLP